METDDRHHDRHHVVRDAAVNCAPPRLGGVIFDMDGTLVDSKLDFDAIKRDMGLPLETPILETLASVPPGPQKDRMLAVLRSHELRAAERAEVFVGVREFLQWIDSRNLPRAILTRNSRESTEITLSRLQLQFDCVLTREDAPPKPDPSGLLAISAQWQVPAKDIVFCGDYLFDIQAGARAGMRTTLYAPQEIPDYAHQADLVLRCFRHAPVEFARTFESGLFG